VKPIVWLGSSLKDVRSFSGEARREAGYQLYKVQDGLEPSDWKPIPSLAPGVQEIRVHTENEYRVLYVAKFSEAVYVLHVFIKKTPRTTKRDLELAREQLVDLMRARRTT
jgi:phage-related protein